MGKITSFASMSDLKGPRPNLVRWSLPLGAAHRRRAEEQLRPDVADRRPHRVVGGDLRLRHVAAGDGRVRDAQDLAVWREMELQSAAEHGDAVERLIELQVHDALVAAAILADLAKRREILVFEAEQVVIVREEPAGDLFRAALGGCRQGLAVRVELPDASAASVLPRSNFRTSPSQLVEQRLRLAIERRRDTGSHDTDVDVRQHPVLRGRLLCAGREGGHQHADDKREDRTPQPRGHCRLLDGLGCWQKPARRTPRRATGFPQQTAQVATVLWLSC